MIIHILKAYIISSYVLSAWNTKIINVVCENVQSYTEADKLIITKLCGRCHKVAMVGRKQSGLSRGDKKAFMEKLTLELD